MRRSAWPWVIGGSILAAVALCFQLVVADWALRTVEAQALVADVQTSEQVMVDTTDAFKAIIESAGSNPDDAAKAKMAADLQAECTKQAARLRAAGQLFVDLRIAPWNRRLEIARQAYQAHNAAWQAYLDAGAVDPTSLFSSDQAAIESTWNTVKATLPEAVPVPDVLGLKKKVDTIITDGSADQSSDGSGGAGGGAAA